ncbi:MAG: hypothetical protein IJS67_00675, partial [Clostridia bacterium]|nr:hypothetical protein [Clostridia bacterium]
MAVVEMSKMVLVGLSREKSAILDEIQKCGAVQIKRAEESELASPLFPSGTDELYAEKERTEKAIATIVAAVEELPKKQRPAVEKDGFGVSREEFFGMGQRRKEMSEIISAVEENAKARASIKAEEGETAAKINAYMPYSSLKETFAFYSDTAFASVYLGLISSDKADAFAATGGESGFSVALGGEYGSDRIVLLVAHKRDKQSAEELLSSFAFRKCTFCGDEKASDIIEREKARLNSLAEKEDEILKSLAMNAKFTRELKLYGDYLAFLIEKSEADGSLLSTEKAFVLEGYVPTEAKD